MNENPVVTKLDIEKFNKGEENSEVENIWKSIVEHLPQNLRSEALKKQILLEELSREMDLITYYIRVKNPSKELKTALLFQNLFLICEFE